MSDLTFPPGVEPILSRPRPDVTFWLWQQVRGLGNVVVWEYTATEGDPPAVLTTTMIQVDCKAHNRQRAYQIADQARRVLKAQPWLDDWPEAVISEVNTIDGPRWYPDENGGPQYVARFEVHHHPRPGWQG